MNEESQTTLRLSTATAFVVVSLLTLAAWGDANCAADSIELSPEHLEAVNRRRRVVVNFDTIHGDRNFAKGLGNQPPLILKSRRHETAPS